jgi:hypothetical protein
MRPVRDELEGGSVRVHRSGMRSSEQLSLEWERVFDRVWLRVAHEAVKGLLQC